MAAEDNQAEGVTAGDSDRYQADSESDSDGYQLDEGLGSLVETWKGMKQGWWNQAGYESYWDYVQEQEKNWARMGFSSIYRKRQNRPKTQELPDASLPELDVDAVASDAMRPRGSRDRQVNVRLTQLGYDALAKAARGYGLRPTTLARLLIHRGALAVLEVLDSDA
jgi:hypothetical protein